MGEIGLEGRRNVLKSTCPEAEVYSKVRTRDEAVRGNSERLNYKL